VHYAQQTPEEARVRELKAVWREARQKMTKD
jgi:hypothetical protein